MLDGKIDISPYKRKKNTSCGFCKYMPVCQFDTEIPGNEYRVLKDMRDEDVWGCFFEQHKVD